MNGLNQHLVGMFEKHIEKTKTPATISEEKAAYTTGLGVAAFKKHYVESRLLEPGEDNNYKTAEVYAAVFQERNAEKKL